MIPATFDTHAAVKKLKEAGFTESQAEAQTALLAEALQNGIAELATHADIALLKTDLEALRAATKADIEALRAATKADIALLEERTAGRFYLLYWMIGFNLAVSLGVLWKLLH